MNVFDNISFGLRMRNFDKKTIGTKVVKALEQVNLTGFEARFQRELSGGEQQRVAIARALINKPKIILADEPTGNLDSANSEIMIDLLFDYTKKSQTSLVIVTHDNSIAKRCDRIIEIRDGQIV